jgi:hypothetical protein
MLNLSKVTPLNFGGRNRMPNGQGTRGERLQLMLSPEELMLVDDFRFKHRMPSRAAAVRELMKRGLTVYGFSGVPMGSKSSDYGVSAPAAPEKSLVKQRR